ncbi:hypothetical protein ACR934_27005, partial [Klebsiella pneumoniae]
KRLLNALIKYDVDNRFNYPILTILEFFNDENSGIVDKDYQLLTAEEEKQVIQAFLEFAY